MIYAIDFDGTLVKNQYPYIGEEQKISTHMLDNTKIGEVYSCHRLLQGIAT